MVQPEPAASLGLVLSGGGARGAYEVGVLSWVADERPQLLDRVRVVAGSSIGALNGVYLASHGMTPGAVRSLADIWLGLRIGKVLRFSVPHLARLGVSGGRWLLGALGRPVGGIFETGAIEKLVIEEVDWPRLRRLVQEGRYFGVAVTATEIGSGRTHVFSLHDPRRPTPRWPHDQGLRAYATAIEPAHVLASASIPVLFPPVRVGDYWYTDGSLRHNTPLSPAIRLGADELLVVSIAADHHEPSTPGRYPGLGQLLGKLLDSYFLDRLRWDLNRLDRINDLIACSQEVGGPDFLPRLQEALRAAGRRPYRLIRYANVGPTEDLGVIAGELLRTPGALRTQYGPLLRRVLAAENMMTADAASFVLFDGAFARRLIELGRADAAAHAGEIDALL